MCSDRNLKFTLASLAQDMALWLLSEDEVDFPRILLSARRYKCRVVRGVADTHGSK